MEKISVIVPAYNAEKTVEKSVLSVLSGSYTNIEVIIVNDGSTDGTAELLDRIAEKDSRVKVIHSQHGGLSKTRNTGLDAVTGQYFTFCDSDDWVETDWLLHQYQTLKKQQADVSVCHCVIENGEKRIEEKHQMEQYEDEEILKRFLEHKKLNGITWNKLVRVELLDGMRFLETASYHEDDYFFFYFLQKCHRLVISEYSDYHFVVNTGSLMGSRMSNKRISDILSIWLEIYAQCKQMGSDYERLARQTLVDMITGLGILLYRDGVTEKTKDGFLLLCETARKLGLAPICEIKNLRSKIIFITLLLGVRIPSWIYKLKS